MLPERKKHRLEKDLYSQPGAYFITVCTQDKKPILSTIVGADDHIGPQVRLSHIGAVVDKYTQLIPGVGHYVIMPNHVHMILHVSAKNPTEGPMWGTREAPPVADAATRASGSGRQMTKAENAEEDAGHRNRSSAPTGVNVQNLVRTWKTLVTKELGQSIWQRSYYDHIIRSEQEYTEIAEYIIGNPGKWAEDKYFL